MKAGGVAIVVALFGLARAAPKQAGDFEERRSAVFREFVDQLEDHADWCTENRLFLERAQTYALIIDYAPDHPEARRALGYRREKAGVWIPPAEPKTLKNRNDAALDEARTRLEALYRQFAQDLVALLEQPGLSPVEVDLVQSDVLRVEPENVRVREMRGDVRTEGQWVSADTRTSTARREELAQAVHEAMKLEPPPRSVELLPRERLFELDFEAAAASLRVLTTGEPAEAIAAARTLRAASELFLQVTGKDLVYPEDCTVFLLVREEDKRAFLERHPALGADARAWLAKLEGSGIPGTADWGFWTGDESKRLDGIVRTAFDWLTSEGFGVTLEHAWLHEGLGLYLTYWLVGTHQTWFVAGGADPAKVFEMRSRLVDPEVDWMHEARAAFAADAKFDLEDLLHLQAGELGADDVLRVYALSAYLVEAQAQALPAILKRVGARENPRDVLQEELGLEFQLLRPRVAHWLDERETSLERARAAEEAALLAAWNSLDGDQKRAVVAKLRERLGSLDTLQARLMRLVLAGSPTPDLVAGETPFYDPEVHAPGDPIPRTRLAPDDPRVLEARSELLPSTAERALRASWTYDWASGKLARSGDPEDPDAIFANALLGYPPELDLALALTLRAIDGAHERKTLAAFAHAYTDRDGNVYPGITLYDAWLSAKTIEMPDVDVLGIVHDLLGDWERWVAPVPGAQHEELYERIGKLFQPARRYREFREALADCFLIGHPVERGEFGPLRRNLHALWAMHGSQPSTLGPLLPDSRKRDDFLKALVEHCRKEPQVYLDGKKRLIELERSGQAVRAAALAALDEVAADR